MNCCVLPTLMDGVPGVTVTVATPPVGGCIVFVDPPPQPSSRRALKKTRDVLRANRSITKLGIFSTLAKSTIRVYGSCDTASSKLSHQSMFSI